MRKNINENFRKKCIHEITEKEANQILDQCRRIFIGEGRSWGGLFIYRSPRRDKPWWSRRKYEWIAIDDTDGELHIRSFKKKDQAIDWLSHSTGPKVVRL